MDRLKQLSSFLSSGISAFKLGQGLPWSSSGYASAFQGRRRGCEYLLRELGRYVPRVDCVCGPQLEKSPQAATKDLQPT